LKIARTFATSTINVMNPTSLLFHKKTIVLFLCCLSIFSHAQDWNQIAKITANVRTEGDNFGRSVAISGNYAVVGGLDNSTLSKAGAAYIFHNDAGTWNFVKKLTADPQDEDDEFGVSVAISGDYIVVGSSKHDEDANGDNSLTDAGSVYIFGKDAGTGWGLIKKIVATDRLPGNLFGHSVAISGGNVVVGTPHIDFASSGEDAGTGSVYVFNKDFPTPDSWGVAKKITADTEGTGFGFAVAIDGLQLVVGAFGDSFTPEGPDPEPLLYTGAAYFFKNDGLTPDNWALQTKLTAIEPTQAGFFGMYVSIHGNRAVVGTPFEDTWSGAAYLCIGDGTSWTVAKKFPPPASIFGFGASVSIYGDNVLIGSVGDGTDAGGGNFVQQAGSVYLHNKDHLAENGWGLVKKIVPADREYFGVFGGAVAVSGNHFIVGATGNSTDADAESVDTPISKAGAAYIFADLAALPVTLVSFEAIKTERQALLRWTTASETNTSYFEVQRSVNGKQWTPLARIEAAKESTTLHPYSYTDTTPNEGQNLYRLKMMDRDGTFTYSRMQNVSFSESLLLTAFPNPVSDKLFFTPSSIDQISSVQIADVTGRVILTTDRISEGLSIESLHSGLYIVRIKKKDQSLLSTRIVVRR
jgi:hypothetical protein